MKLIDCPECGKILAERALRCRCGWKKTTLLNPQRLDDRCQYVFGERRCPLTGTVSISIFGTGNWYCIKHWETLGDPKKAEKALNEIEKNYQDIVASRRDWRDEMHNNYFKKLAEKKNEK